MNQTSKRRLEQIRRRWWVVVAVTVIALLAATVFSLLARPTYVGKSILMVTGRIPEQDAPMVVGYLDIFRDPATMNWLRAEAKIPEDVTFEARTVANSPMLAIEATADDPEVAQNAAVTVAETFGHYINAAQQEGKEKSAADLERQLAKTDPFTPNGSQNPQYTLLLERLENTRNSVNELLGLQPRAGVSRNAPSVVFNLVTAAMGGLLLGILTAVGLAAVSTRLANSADLRDKAGVEPLAEVPAAGSVKLHRLREDRLRALATIVSLEDLPKPTFITLTDSSGRGGARDIAEALAELSAQQGSRTVLVYADNDASRPAAGVGFNDALLDSDIIRDVLRDGHVESLKILAAGGYHTDRYSLATRERIVALFNALRTIADTVIVAAPSIAEAAETQLLCAAADVTILVVPRGSRVGDVTSATEKLAKAHAVLLGAVLNDGTNRKQRGVQSTRTPKAASKPSAPTSQHLRGPPAKQPAIAPFDPICVEPRGDK